MIIAAMLAVPATVVAQSGPNENASDTAKSKVAAHRQNPTLPDQAADSARSAIERRATRTRGTAVGTDNRPVTPASPATPATPATKGDGGAATPATPAVPATPASPASPTRPDAPTSGTSRRPDGAGQSAGRRP
jgi:hypothetical protein